MRRAILAVVVGAFALLAIAGIVWFALPGKPSVVTLRNAGPEAVDLSVTTTNPSSYSWQGSLRPGEQVSRTATFGDNSFQIACRDSKARTRRQIGYVTAGLAFVVTVTIKGCDNVTYADHTIP